MSEFQFGFLIGAGVFYVLGMLAGAVALKLWYAIDLARKLRGKR